MTNFNMLSSKIKHGYALFCQQTSIHGFLEIFYANSIFWKTFWLLAIFGAFCATGYQLCGTIDQYLDQVPITSLEPCPNINYPPIYFCSPSMLLWLNFDKLAKTFENANLQYNESVYAIMSYFYELHASDFDISASFAKFDDFLRNYPLENLLIDHAKFYYAIHINSDLVDYENFRLVAGDKDLNLCMEINRTVVEEKLTKNNKNKITLELQCQVNSLQETNFGPWDFLNSYDMSYLLTNVQNINPDFGALVKMESRSREFFMLDGSYEKIILGNLYDDGSGSAQEYKYTFTLRPFVQKLIPKTDAFCKVGKITMYTTSFCEETCEYVSLPDYFMLNTTCTNFVKYVMEKEVSLDYTNANDLATHFCRHKLTSGENLYFNQFSSAHGPEHGLEECMFACNGACEKWTWEVLTTEKQKPLGSGFENPRYVVDIIYPPRNAVLAFTETWNRSWEDLIGNIGGLLGIWTGASVLSLLQLFYLFCCAPQKTAPDVPLVNTVSKAVVG